MSIEYRILTEIPEEDLKAMEHLYRSIGWIGPEDPAGFIAHGMLNAAVAVGAYCDGVLIGMGRALSDNVSDAYIQDIAVSPDYRKHGVGGGIVKTIIGELRSRGVDWIALVGEPGTEHFYRELGFEAPAGFTFWKLKS